MINELNIKIFDYIFSITTGYKYYMLDNVESYYIDQLNQEIEKKFNLNNFWKEYRKCISSKSIIINEDDTFKYLMFPRMNLNAKKDYLNYKLRQLKNIIYDNGEFVDSDFKDITENIINVGKMEILNYCEQIGIIQYNGKVFLSADNFPACEIIYDNIDAVIYTEEEVSSLMIENMIVVNGDGNNFKNIEQNVSSKNNNDKLFELVLNKLDLLEKEGVTKSDLKMLELACKEKNKNKVIEFLKEIATNSISSIVASGILYAIGKN